MATIQELLEKIRAGSGGSPSVETLPWNPNTPVSPPQTLPWNPNTVVSPPQTLPWQPRNPDTFLDRRPYLWNQEQRPEGWRPRAEPYRWGEGKGEMEKLTPRDFMQPLGERAERFTPGSFSGRDIAERDVGSIYKERLADRPSGSWWKTSNLRKWRQRNR